MWIERAGFDFSYKMAGEFETRTDCHRGLTRTQDDAFRQDIQIRFCSSLFRSNSLGSLKVESD